MMSDQIYVHKFTWILNTEDSGTPMLKVNPYRDHLLGPEGSVENTTRGTL